MIVLDSYAWIEYFLGSDAGAIVREHLNTEETATPSVVLAEIARKFLRETLGEEEVLNRLNFISVSTEIIEIDADLSLLAAKAYMELSERARKEHLRKPSLTDGIVLATGRTLRTKILTGDEHFKGLTEVTYLQ